MKKIFMMLTMFLVICCLTVAANAVLVDNGDGTITDTDRGLMYYDLTYSTNDWSNAMTWIDTLNSANTLGYNDWKLPSALNSDGSGPCGPYSFDCTDSDLGHLYYVELGNPAGGPATNTGPFNNLVITGETNPWYWTETAYDGDEVNPPGHWILTFNKGNQHTHYSPYDANPNGYAMAVRVFPEPISTVLFVTGGAIFGAGSFRRKRKQKYYR